jgi:DNA primase
MKSYDLDRLRQVDFTPLIKTRITSAGDKKRMLCPFHDENNPSFFIYPNNSYYCFGCGVHGNAIDFVMQKLGYSFKQACEFLQNL